MIARIGRHAKSFAFRSSFVVHMLNLNDIVFAEVSSHARIILCCSRHVLQDQGRELPFREYFQPTSFLRSSGVGSTIMGAASARCLVHVFGGRMHRACIVLAQSCDMQNGIAHLVGPLFLQHRERITFLRTSHSSRDQPFARSVWHFSCLKPLLLETCRPGGHQPGCIVEQI